MGFDYEVKYKKGVENAAADALSRVQDTADALLKVQDTADALSRVQDTADALSKVQADGILMTTMVVTMPAGLSARITGSWEQDVTLKQLLTELQAGSCTKKHYTWSNNQLFRKK